MPKIGEWSRMNSHEKDLDTPVTDTAEAAWKHDETGEVVYVSHKVPNDGYYVMYVPPEEDLIHGLGERLGFDTYKSTAMSIATDKLKDNKEGFREETER